jgi:hypothetical protein
MNGLSKMGDPVLEARAGTRSPRWSVTAELGACYTVEMSVEDWNQLADHPRRRDPERHSRKPDWEMLLRSARGPVMEMLRWVAAGQVGDEVWKVDGHSRARLWATGGLLKPKSVFVKVFRCESIQALHELYSTFDHPAAAETLFDRVSGAYHQHGLNFQSERLRPGTIGDALAIAWRGVARTGQAGIEEDDMDIYNVVGAFAAELSLLDSINPQNDIFQTGIIAAALLSLTLDPELIGYFERVAKRMGNKRNGLLDPVEALLHMIAGLKGRGGSWAKAQQQELCAAALTGATIWKAGESHPHHWVEDALPPADVQATVRRVRELKRAKGLDSGLPKAHP